MQTLACTSSFLRFSRISISLKFPHSGWGASGPRSLDTGATGPDRITTNAIAKHFGRPGRSSATRRLFRNQQVAVFLNIGAARTGYVAPAGVGFIHIDLANIHARVPQLLHELKEQYGFEHFDASPLHGSIKLFASFVARARRHQLNGLADEALLHFIIALELIFGVREAIQRSVSERVALISFRQANRSFVEQRNWINRMYDLRSRYVHEGAKLDDNAPLEEMYALCEQVFRCLMRLQAARPEVSQRQKDALARWLALLDFLSKGMIAGQIISEQQLREAFVS